MSLLDTYRISLEKNNRFYEQDGNRLLVTFGAPGMPLKMTINFVERVPGKPTDRIVIIGGLEDGSPLARDIMKLDKQIEALLLISVLNSHGWWCGRACPHRS